MNDPIMAWVLQVYLRDRGFFLWLAPSGILYGGFAARIERFQMMQGYVTLVETDARFVQDAARDAAERIDGFAWPAFEVWRAEWETKASIQT